MSEVGLGSDEGREGERGGEEEEEEEEEDREGERGGRQIVERRKKRVYRSVERKKGRGGDLAPHEGAGCPRHPANVLHLCDLMGRRNEGQVEMQLL